MKKLAVSREAKEKTKKSKNREKPGRYVKCMTAIGLIVIIAGSSVWFFYGRSQKEKKTSDNIQQAQVTTGTVQTSVEGTGTLAYADATSVLLPENLKMQEIYVTAGDEVNKGSKLATVDEASLYSSMEEVEEALDDVNTEISQSSSTTTKSITAKTSGRIKKIYGKTGSNVAEVIKNKGALMLISTDGKMKVTLNNIKDLSAGDTVTVVGSADQSKTGTVEQVSDGNAVITMTDQSFDLGETVTVKKKKTVLGEGKAEIHQPVKVLAESGTVSSVSVSKNDTVSSSTVVCTLKNANPSSSYLQAVKQREVLQNLLAELISIQSAGGICAKKDGTITEINVEAGTETANAGTTEAESLDTASKDSQKDSASAKVSDKTKSVSSGFFNVSTLSSGVETKVRDLQTAAIAQISSAQTGLQSSETEQQATTQQASLSTEQPAASSETEQQTATDATTQATKNDSSDDPNVADKSKVSVTEKTASYTTSVQQSTQQSNSSEQNNKKNTSSSTAVSQSATESSSVSGVETVNAFCIADNEKMTLTVNVDEMDISTIEVGQEAEITVDAIEDKTFDGSITKVSKEADAENGVTQYPVEISLEKEDGMLSGMNASVNIVLEKKENVLVVPAAAVSDKGAFSYVYTSLDNNQLSGEQEVTTGISDDSQTEIVSGLKEGDTVYYKIAGDTQDTSQTKTEKGEFPGERGGDMPQRNPGQTPDSKGSSGGPGGDMGGQAPQGMGNQKPSN